MAKYIKEHGEGSWRSMPKNAGLLRCGKSCRLRWINYLRADLKRGNISEEEEEMIIKLHATLGNRWSLIAGHLPGRTDNEIKNYWNSHLSRRSHDFPKGGDGVVVNVDLSKLPGGGKRRGGRVGRATATTAKGKRKARGKKAGKVKKDKVAEMEHHHHHHKEDATDEEAMNSISTPSSCHSGSARGGEEQAQASASGVTSDGFDEAPLGLCEEMVSGLKAQPSPHTEVGQDVSGNEGESAPEKTVRHEELSSSKAAVVEQDQHGCCNEGECGTSGPAKVMGQEELGDKAMDCDHNGCCDKEESEPAEAVGLEEPVDDKAMEWDLVGLDDSLPTDDMWGSLVWDYDDMVISDGGQQQESVLSDLFFLDNI